MDNNLALHAAIVAFDTENFDRLLHYPDVDINYKNDEGKTPLMASIKKTLGSTMAMSLIRAGCDLNCKDLNGSTPLHEALKINLIDVVHELILRGANINEQTATGESPLYSAILSGNLDAVCLLLYYQADVNMPTGTCEYNRTHLIDAFHANQTNICEVLLDYCDNLSSEDCDGETAFSCAVHCNNTLAIDLLRRGASVNSIGDSINIPLCKALYSKDSELFKFILPKYKFRPSDHDLPFLDQYVSECNFSNSEWLECFYLILKSPIAINFIRDQEDYLKENSYAHSCLYDIICGFAQKDGGLKDRISIMYICLSLGARVKAADLQYIHLFLGSNDEFEAVVYTGDLSYNTYKKQMRLLFKEPFNSTIPQELYYVFFDSQYYPTFSKKTFCSLGFFSVSPEKRKQYLAWIETKMPKNRNVILEELDKIPQFPSLLELSRDQAVKFIEVNFKIVKAHQFYSIVKSLKLSRFEQDIILFKRRIY